MTILPKVLKLLGLFALAIILLLLIITVPFINKVYPNIYISNIYVGDKSKVDATSYYKNSYKTPSKFTLSVNGQKNDILTAEIIKEIDYSKAVDRAYKLTHSGNFILDLANEVKLIFNPQNLPSVINFDEDKLLETILITTNSANLKPILPSVKKINGEIKADAGKDGIEIDTAKTRQDIGLSLTSGDTKDIPVSFSNITVKLNTDQLEKYRSIAQKLIGKEINLVFENEKKLINDDELISFLEPSSFSDEKIKNEALTISKKINRNPQDSVFIIENGIVTEFNSSKDGVIVNENLLTNSIKDSLTQLINSATKSVEIEIPTIKTSPKINNKDVNTLGINTMLGRGQSNFRGSIPNRIFNVNLAQSKFKGLLVPPNEVVSFNEVLGDVSGLTGYKAAYVIKDGKTVLGDGGGVCQVSTTLFRAVLNAGLPIIERRAHAYRVGYYEQGFAPGLDATVYSPTTDFKFKNDTPAYLLIQPTINLDNLSLQFEVYGTSDGRVSTISKPVITSSVAPADDLYVDDPTLPAGTIKQIEHRAYGAKVIFDYKVTRNGEELINQKFVSNYRPWQAVYLRGTAQ